jgi:hypothetical protein
MLLGAGDIPFAPPFDGWEPDQAQHRVFQKYRVFCAFLPMIMNPHGKALVGSRSTRKTQKNTFPLPARETSVSSLVPLSFPEAFLTTINDVEWSF